MRLSIKLTCRKVTKHDQDKSAYSKNGTHTKKTAGYEVQQTTAVFLMFICKTSGNTVKDERMFVCFCCVPF